MFDLFHIPQTGERSLVTAGPWHTARTALQENTNKVVAYYQMYPQVISSSHFLIKLIYAMNISKSIPIDRFYNYCKQYTYSVSQTMGLTSAISKGRLLDGVFYGPGSTEVIIANDEYFDLELSHQNWKTLRPVRVLHHSKSDINMNIPDGRYSSSEQGIAVLTLNVPMLMTQYYHFTKEQDALEKTGAPRKTVMQFVYSYALTNMVYSHLDYAIFNRLCKIAAGEATGQAFLRHSFAMVNTSLYVDNALRVVNKFLNDNGTMRSYQKFINIPSVHCENFAEVLELPKTAPTIQIYWALILSRIKCLSFLLTTYDDPRRVLGAELNLIQRFLRIHGVAVSLRSILNARSWNDIYEDMEFIKMT